MQKRILQKQRSRSKDNELNDSDDYHTPLSLTDNFVDGASKKKNFSFIDLQNGSNMMSNSVVMKALDPERKNYRSKTEIQSPSPEKKQKTTETSKPKNENEEEYNEKNLMNIKKDYEKRIISRDLDQSLVEISNIKIIQTTCTNCNISFLDETLHLSEKVPVMNNEVKFPKNQMKLEVAAPNKQNNNVSTTVLEEYEKKNCKKNGSVYTSSINQHLFRNLVFSPSISEPAFKSHLLNTYKGLVYAKKFLKPPSTDFLREKMVTLSEVKAPKYKTLFFDLDETLIHTCPAGEAEAPDHLIKGNDEKGNEILIALNVRPLCVEFLKKVSQYFEVYIFTAATSNYANAIVNFLDPMGQVINGVFSRNHCLMTKNGMFIKDLRIVKNRDLKNMLLIDNLSHSFGLQIENGIPILEFQNDRKDRELKYLYDYLLQALYVDDIRSFNKKNLKLNYLASLRMEELLKN